MIVEESDYMQKGFQFMATDNMPESDLSVNCSKVMVEESESVSSLQNTLSEIVLRVS